MAQQRDGTEEPIAVAAGSNSIPPGFSPANFSPGFLDHGGPYYLKKGANGWTVGCLISPHHMNYQDRAHGGVLTTLADVALSWSVYSSETPPLVVSTVSLTTNFLGGVRLGDWVEANSQIDRIGKTLAYVHGSISVADRLVMTMNGVFNIVRSPSA